MKTVDHKPHGEGEGSDQDSCPSGVRVMSGDRPSARETAGRQPGNERYSGAAISRSGLHLTDKLVKELPAPPPPRKNWIFYDVDPPGFGVRVTSAGARSFVLNYRAKGIERRPTIGPYPAWNVKQARTKAREMRRRVDDGADPKGERDAERAAPTVNDLADRFESEHLPKKRDSTIRDYKALLRRHIRPALGKIRVADLRHADGARLHRKIAVDAPYVANRTAAVLSKMGALAVTWEMRADNPFRGIERAMEEKRERFLSPAEIARLGEVLAAHPERASANAVRLLLLTGARKSEALSATWDQFDLATGVWVKPAATTKQKKLHRIPLSAPALALLTEMKAEADQENARRERDRLPPIAAVFPSVNGKPLQDVKHFWAAVIKKAGLPGVRVHDLRHTYASVLASSGLSLPIIGALLGHTQASTTQRYSHLLDDPLRAATERAGAVITGAGKDGAEVLPMGRRA